mgnify:CR=1 FL=1
MPFLEKTNGGVAMKIDGVNSTVNNVTNSYTADVKSVQSVPDISSNVTSGAEAMVANNVIESNQKNAPSENTIKQAVSDINKRINPNTVAKYGFHDETNRVTIKIVDKNSDKVIKEFPAEETLDMIAKVWELAGIMVDEKR